jgi:hypothetical protein
MNEFNKGSLSSENTIGTFGVSLTGSEIYERFGHGTWYVRGESQFTIEEQWYRRGSSLEEAIGRVKALHKSFIERQVQKLKYRRTLINRYTREIQQLKNQSVDYKIVSALESKKRYWVTCVVEPETQVYRANLSSLEVEEYTVLRGYVDGVKDGVVYPLYTLIRNGTVLDFQCLSEYNTKHQAQLKLKQHAQELFVKIKPILD